MNKQIEKLIDKHIFINDDGTPTSSSKLVSQIKQSILKAIMESDEPRLYDENSDSYYVNLAVIKEILK